MKVPPPAAHWLDLEGVSGRSGIWLVEWRVFSEPSVASQLRSRKRRSMAAVLRGSLWLVGRSFNHVAFACGKMKIGCPSFTSREGIVEISKGIIVPWIIPREVRLSIGFSSGYTGYKTTFYCNKQQMFPRIWSCMFKNTWRRVRTHVCTVLTFCTGSHSRVKFLGDRWSVLRFYKRGPHDLPHVHCCVT